MGEQELRLQIATQQRAFEIQRKERDEYREAFQEAMAKLEQAKKKIREQRRQLRWFNRMLNPQAKSRADRVLYYDKLRRSIQEKDLIIAQLDAQLREVEGA